MSNARIDRDVTSCPERIQLAAMIDVQQIAASTWFDRCDHGGPPCSSESLNAALPDPGRSCGLSKIVWFF
jgi:hypothetical protein